MKHGNSLNLALAFATLWAALPALAHHAFEAEFDVGQKVKVTGTLVKVDWVNPHMYFYVEVKDTDGKVVTWSFQNGPPLMLRSGGLERDMLTIGQQVTVDGYGAKDGTKHLGWANILHMQDGRVITLNRPKTAP